MTEADSPAGAVAHILGKAAAEPEAGVDSSEPADTVGQAERVPSAADTAGRAAALEPKMPVAEHIAAGPVRQLAPGMVAGTALKPD